MSFRSRSDSRFALGKPVQAFGERTGRLRTAGFWRRLPGTSLPVSSIGSSHRRQALGHGGRHARPWPNLTSIPTPGSSRPTARDSLPFAILLEVALQPCGWLAAYMGSALNSDEDLKFRNLGGSACQHRRSLAATRHADHAGQGHQDHERRGHDPAVV